LISALPSSPTWRASERAETRGQVAQAPNSHANQPAHDDAAWAHHEALGRSASQTHGALRPMFESLAYCASAWQYGSCSPRNQWRREISPVILQRPRASARHSGGKAQARRAHPWPKIRSSVRISQTPSTGGMGWIREATVRRRAASSAAPPRARSRLSDRASSARRSGMMKQQHAQFLHRRRGVQSDRSSVQRDASHAARAWAQAGHSRCTCSRPSRIPPLTRGASRSPPPPADFARVRSAAGLSTR